MPSSIEAFPLFGHDLADYDTLFAEKLEPLRSNELLGTEVAPRIRADTATGQRAPA